VAVAPSYFSLVYLLLLMDFKKNTRLLALKILEALSLLWLRMCCRGPIWRN
jgi:hypothetical protein